MHAGAGVGVEPAARTGVTRETVMGASPTSSSPVVHAIQRMILRTARTPLGRLSALAYRATARAVTAYLTWGDREAAVYVRGGVATGDFLPGVSDVDTTIVFAWDPAAAEARARRRWRRLIRAVPATELLVETPMVFEGAALDELAGASALTLGLDRPGEPVPARAGYFGTHASIEWQRTLERPGLYGLGTDWRRLAGPEWRPRLPARDLQAQRIAAWLELLFWWRWAFPACVDPSGPRTASLCLKLVAEPTRVWLWLAHGERHLGRVDVLRAGLRRMPEEEPALRRALALHKTLVDSPDPPLADALQALTRISARIAERLCAQLQDEDATDVLLTTDSPELMPGGGQSRPLPLADWRALVCPLLAEEAFVPLPGDPSDPATLAAAARLNSGPYPALRTDGLMVFPAAPWWRTRLRAVQCPVTDPVSFALADGNRAARFPGVRGWSAEDVACRAVAEHRAWLADEPAPWMGDRSARGNGHALGMLFTAARAALLHESIRTDCPQLALGVAETARQVALRSPYARGVVEEALGRYGEFARDGCQPPTEVVGAMRGMVLGLPPYADATDVRRVSGP